MQKPDAVTGGAFVPVVALTHGAQEARLEAALNEIATSGVVSQPPVRLRLLEE